MAKVIVILDDLDRAKGTETRADVTVTLALDGRQVELDLTQAHASDLAQLLAPWLACGEVIKSGTPSASPRRSVRGGHGKAPNPETVAMLDWADANGYEYRSTWRKGDETTYYPVSLRAAWAVELRRRNGQQQGVASGRPAR